MTSKKLVDLPIDRIATAFNIRVHFDQAEVEALAATIKRIGIEHPIHVRLDGDKYVIIDGERRFRAALLAKLESVPAIVDERPSTIVEIVERQLIADCRSSLRPIEKGQAIDRLMKEAGWSVSQAASRLGLSIGQVSKLLSMLTLPESIREQVGKSIRPGEAYQLTTIADPAEQAALAVRLTKGEITREDVIAHRKAKKSGDAITKPAPSMMTANLGQGQTVTVRAAGLTLDSLISLLELLLGKARKAKPKGISLSTFVRMLREESKSCAH